MRRLTLPNWVQATIHPNLDLAPNLTLPVGKVVGIDTLVNGMTWASAKQKGFTHKHTINEAGVAASELFFTILSNQLSKSTTYNGQPAATQSDAESLAAGMAGIFNSQSVFTDEFTDQATAIHPDTYWQVANWFYSKFAEITNSNPATSNVMGGYMEGQNSITPNNFRINTNLTNSVPLHPYYTSGLANQAAARKTINLSNQTYNDDFPFFQAGLHTKVNLMTQSYVGMNTPNEEQWFYGILNEVQRKYLAGIKRTILYCAPWSQSVSWGVDLQGKNSGYRIERPETGAGNAFTIKEWPATSPSFLQFAGFFGLLMADGWVMWDSIRDFVSKNPQDLNWPEYANQGFWGEWLTTNNAPQPAWKTTRPFYPHRPLCNVDIAVAMMEWYMQIHNLTNGMKYIPYTTGGTSVSVLGNNPTIPTATNLNYGNTTLLQWAHDRRGLCVGNKVGNDWWVAYFNPYLSALEVENIVANVDGQSVSFQAIGRKLAVLTS